MREAMLSPRHSTNSQPSRRNIVHPCATAMAMLFFLIKFSSADVTDTGLCRAVPHHPLRNLGPFFHTTWLDEDFCRYPNQIHSQLPDPAQECLPTNTTVLDRLLFMCNMAPGQRSRQNYQRLQLPFCAEYTVERVFGDQDECVMRGNTAACRDCMESVYLIDQHAKFVYCHFVQDILARFDCETPFSVRWNCTDCQTAYRRWLCSMMIPFRMGEYRIKPCRSFCTKVEQRCPYLTPDDKVIIAGEPMFLCKDPDIPELYSAYDDPPHCYLPCHLNVTTGEEFLEPEEDCARHELLKEELAVYYNMSKKRSAAPAAVRCDGLLNGLLALFMLTAVITVLS